MMPGHEDREDQDTARLIERRKQAAMMPGHEDREDVADVRHRERHEAGPQ